MFSPLSFFVFLNFYFCLCPFLGLLFLSSFPFTPTLLSCAFLPHLFLNFFHLLLFCHSSRFPKKSVMVKDQPATQLRKSNTPPMSKRGKRTTLFPQSGRTDFSTIVPTEVNYGWPSILHTLKRTASTGRKTLSICYIHQSFL